MTRLIVDTDTAGDDAVSLLIALRRPRDRARGDHRLCGNVRFEQEVENALYTVEAAGRSGEVPVYAGCPRPLLAEWVGASTSTARTGWETPASRPPASVPRGARGGRARPPRRTRARAS